MLEQQQKIMFDYISNFPNHLIDANQIGSKIELNIEQPKNILICGLGGSGIGGRLIAGLLKDSSPIPINVLNGYNIPAWVDENTLVIASSYSGNTEETIFAIKSSLKKTNNVVIITSGGEALDIAVENNLTYYQVPGGCQPRAMLGYSVVQLSHIMNKLGFWNGNISNDWVELSRFLENNKEDIKQKAEEIAIEIENTTPILYADDQFEPVLIRFRQQLNENAKILCWHHVYPEMNHNELVGWQGAIENLSVINLYSGSDNERNKIRMEFCKKAMAGAKHVNIYSKGKSLFENYFYFIHFTDWVSYFLSVEKSIDPVEVNIIMKLKSTLAGHEASKS
jgi:glucose/mannose-6-phosphate isomerase